MAIQRRPKSGATLKQVKPEREPVSMQKVMKHLVTLLILVVVLGGAFYIDQQDTFPVKHVTIEGDLPHTDRDALVQAVTPFVSGNFLNVDVASIRAAGEAQPWVKQIQVKRVWPDTLHLIVEEHNAVARWNEKGLVNTLGQVFYPTSQDFPKGLVQLHGPQGTSELMARRLVDMQKSLNQLGLVIAEVKMDKRRSWQLLFSDGLSLKLGRADSEQRLARFIEVFNGGLAQYKADMSGVDMRYTNGLAVEWKADQQPDFNGTV